MTDVVLILALLCVAALVVSLVAAPLESLRWWAGWLGPDEPVPPLASDDDIAPSTGSPTTAASDDPALVATLAATDEGRAVARARRAPVETGPAPRAYLVFLSGIGSISGDELLPQERALLDRLAAGLPDVVIVDDVFPYAPSGRSLLTGQRIFAAVWRRIDRMRLKGIALLPAILNLRNLFQVLVSADGRYGPIYSFALARMIRDGLARRGYDRTHAAPVVLIGFSGGGQISLGAATYLSAALEAPIRIVTIGGVMASDPGLEVVERLTRLYGGRDKVQRIGAIAFPGRWPVMRGSFWNTALDEGRIDERRIGEMGHAGRGGYMDEEPGPGGAPSMAERTAAAVIEAVGAPEARAAG